MNPATPMLWSRHPSGNRAGARFHRLHLAKTNNGWKIYDIAVDA